MPDRKESEKAYSKSSFISHSLFILIIFIVMIFIWIYLFILLSKGKFPNLVIVRMWETKWAKERKTKNMINYNLHSNYNYSLSII